LFIELHVAKIFCTCHAFLAHSTGAHNNQREFADIINYRWLPARIQSKSRLLSCRWQSFLLPAMHSPHILVYLNPLPAITQTMANRMRTLYFYMGGEATQTL
jgi:hypothetical protein